MENSLLEGCFSVQNTNVKIRQGEVSATVMGHPIGPEQIAYCIFTEH